VHELRRLQACSKRRRAEALPALQTKTTIGMSTTYSLVTSTIAILIGLTTILFRKRIADAQRELAAKKSGFVYERIASRPPRSAYLVLMMVGIVFIVLGLLQLLWA
jgi:hypothetical protein